MQLEDWQALAVVCGALVALFTLLGLLYRWVVRPVLRIIRRLNEVADQLLGEPARDGRPARPSLAERMTQMQQQLDEHLSWHAGRGRGNSPRPLTPTRK
jgi:nitrate/nitrite-specific signal transduction histidine kinase